MNSIDNNRGSRLIFCFLSLLFSSLVGFAQHSISYRLDIASNVEIETKEEIDGNIYSSAKLLDFSGDAPAIGAPLLPTKVLNFIVPANAKSIRISVHPLVDPEVKSLSYPLIPKQAPKIDSTPPYLAAGFVPVNLNLYEVDTIRTQMYFGNYRDARILSLSICPFNYSLQANLLKYFREVQVNIAWESDVESMAKVFDSNIVRPALEEIVLNPQDIPIFIDKESINPLLNAETMRAKMQVGNLPDDCDYLLITTSDLLYAFDPFIKWRRRCGFDVQIALLPDIYAAYEGDHIGDLYDNAGKIRQYLRELLSTSQGKLRFVLLGGRIDQIPTREDLAYGKQCGTDFYFAELTGGWYFPGHTVGAVPLDHVPELAVGRVSAADPNEAFNWVSKLLCYEQDPGRGDPSYLMKGFFTQSDDLQTDNSSEKVFFNPKSKWQGLPVVWNEEQGANSLVMPTHPTGKEVISEANKAYGLLSFLGHGSTDGVSVATKGLNVSFPGERTKFEVNTFDYQLGEQAFSEDGNSLDCLTNINSPSVYVSLSCGNMEFNMNKPEYRNFAEGFTSISSGGGPLFIGSSNYGSLAMTSSLLRDMMHNANMPLGEALNIAKAFAPGVSVYLQTLGILGCPATKLWLEVPKRQSITANYNISSKILSIHGANLSGSTIAVQDVDEGTPIVRIATENTVVIQNVPERYQLTITKPAYYPFFFPVKVFLQNEIIQNERTIVCDELIVGRRVTNEVVIGDVVIEPSGHLDVKAVRGIFLRKGFRCLNGGTMLLKPL